MKDIAIWIAALCCAGVAAAAEPSARLPGIGADDPRAEVEMTQPPWNAIVKVQTNLANSCTGALVAADIVLTAAHCLYNPRTRRMLQGGSLHVLFGYQRGDYASHHAVTRYVAGTDRPNHTVADWALLDLAPGDESNDVVPLRLAETPVGPGDPVAMAGFSRDRKHVLLADRACHVTGTGPLVQHNCTGTFGSSGAPLLARRGPRWEIVGVTAALASDGAKLAVPASVLRAALAEFRRQSSTTCHEPSGC